MVFAYAVDRPICLYLIIILFMPQDVNNPKYGVMMLMAIYATVALKKSPQSYADQVIMGFVY